MKAFVLFLTIAVMYTAAQTPFRIKTADTYQGDAIDMLDPSRPRLA